MLAHGAASDEQAWQVQTTTISLPVAEMLPAPATGSAAGASGSSKVVSPLSAVPALSSRPGTPFTLYLDFDGDGQERWGDYYGIVTPAFDQDGDPTTFSAGELSSIRQIWQQVAEDYAPFKVNVTTVQPSDMSPGSTLHVVIGGTGAWTGGVYGGMAFVGGFTDVDNTVFVFSANLAGGDPKFTADSISHESGHGFGLNHQSAYDADGVKTQEYSPGPGDGRAPLMGNSFAAARGVWWSGPSTSATTTQDDMAVLTRVLGLRPDDHGNDADHATPLIVSGNVIAGSGIIETTADVDYFSFDTGAGTVTATVTPLSPGGNLDATLELRDDTGLLLIAADPTDSTSATISALVPAGSYRLVVGSHGAYGDVGQYTLTGTIVPPADPISTPTLLTATGAGNAIALAWIDNANNETGYTVFRSLDGANWSVLASLPSNTTAMVDAGLAFGMVYYYQVQATSGASHSEMSNRASAWTSPAPPSAATAKGASTSRIDLTWSDVAGEDSYTIERSSDRGATWTVLAKVGADTTTYQDTGLAAATMYFYRVRAGNAAGDSSPSNVASATTAAPAPAPPAAPTSLSAAALSTRQVELHWTDGATNEKSYLVERSADGGKTWTIVAMRPADATTCTDLGVAAGKTYQYRVSAVNEAGPSAYATAAVSTPVRPRVAPPLPTGLKVVSTAAGEVSLRWNDNSRTEVGFVVERSADNGRTWSKIGQTTANVTSYADRTVAAAKTYWYRVRAYNDAGVSSYTTVRVTAPPAPKVSAAYAAYMTLPAPTAKRAADAAFSDQDWVGNFRYGPQ